MRAAAPRRATTVALAFGLALASAAWAPSPETAPPLATADHDLMDRVLHDSDVVRAVPRPSLPGYLSDLALWAVHGIFRRLERSGAGRAAFTVAVVVGIAAVLLVLGLVVWALLSRRSPRRVPGRRDPAAPRREEEVPLPGREEWKAELERRLSGHDVVAALEALWWWFARSVGGATVDPAWTSRELLARAGRGDLQPLVVDLDGMIYGPQPSGPTDVRRLFVRMQEVLP